MSNGTERYRDDDEPNPTGVCRQCMTFVPREKLDDLDDHGQGVCQECQHEP